jgi:hypothetical protein
MSGLHPAWREYRRRLRALLAACAGAAAIGAGYACALGGSAPGELPRRVLLSAALTACAAAGIWFARFRCPSCARHFHWTWWVSNPFARRCLHCGFEKWRDPRAGRELSRR